MGDDKKFELILANNGQLENITEVDGCRLAEKQGYEFDHGYIAYEVSWEERTY